MTQETSTYILTTQERQRLPIDYGIGAREQVRNFGIRLDGVRERDLAEEDAAVNLSKAIERDVVFRRGEVYAGQVPILREGERAATLQEALSLVVNYPNFFREVMGVLVRRISGGMWFLGKEPGEDEDGKWNLQMVDKDDNFPHHSIAKDFVFLTVEAS